MRRIAAVLAALLAAGCASRAAAPDLPPLRAAAAPFPEEGTGPAPLPGTWEERHGFHVTLMPYAWRTAAEGDVEVRGTPASFGGGGARETARGGRIEVASEGVAVFLDGFHAPIHGRGGGTEVDARTFVLDFGAAMRFAGLPPSIPPEGRPVLGLDLDGLALIRTHVVNMEADPAGAFGASTRGALWLDLVLGVRGEAALLGRLSAFGSIDGGGMATNLHRSYSWKGDAGAKVRLTRNLGFVAAYRWYRVHLEDLRKDTAPSVSGPVEVRSSLDARLRGPWAGLVLEF